MQDIELCREINKFAKKVKCFRSISTFDCIVTQIHLNVTESRGAFVTNLI